MEATKEVRIVGIWGVGGIGKTTIAQALFDRIAHTFEGSSFVANVRENSSTKKDICGLQQKILDHILGEHHGYKIEDSDKGAEIIQERCRGKKVLLVLDDVNDVEQLEFLAATPAKWLGPGSRIIITTRDQHLLSHVDEKYKPDTLSGDQAVELFNTHAFNKTSPPEGYEELSIRAIRSTGGLPLALVILGSLLHRRPSDVWESALDRLVVPIKEIYDAREFGKNVLQTKKGGWTYDVFLSFRGRDTLHSFVNSLYAELVWNGIRVFKDDGMLDEGQTILEKHVKAIKESRFAIVVLSKNYANSVLCLEELSTIMECQNQMGDQKKVLPVFYHVKPSGFHNKNRDFAAAFETHEHKFKGEMNKVYKWRDALTAAASLPGGQDIPSDNGGAAALIINHVTGEVLEQTQIPGARREPDPNSTDPQSDAPNVSPEQTKEITYKHDVFLSFRSEDTGNNFSDHLYAALVEEIKVFKHDYTGQTISDDVVKAIKESRFVVVVFSTNYANSSLCKDELNKIKESHDQKVLPVFYHVHESDMGQNVLARLPNGLRIPPNNTRGESALVKDIIERIFERAEISERKIRSLSFSKEEIGRGSNQTIVLEGRYETRHAAVKRLKKTNLNDDKALQKIQELIQLDHHHDNIVRCYGVEDDRDYIYIALERCNCSLYELILLPTNSTVPRDNTLTSKWVHNWPQLTPEERESFRPKQPIDQYPSPKLLEVMRDTVAGLAYLHKQGFIHRGLKPKNVIISKNSSSKIRAKVSDTGISKSLPANTSSSSSATGTANTLAADLCSLGWLLFFCITGDDKIETDTDIIGTNLSLLKDKIPEAYDLVSNLIMDPVPPEPRPSAAEVYHHPLFWDADTRLSFFHVASKRLRSEDPEEKGKKKKPLKKGKKSGFNQALEENEKKKDPDQPFEEKEKKTESKLLEALEKVGTIVFDGANEWKTKLDTDLQGVIGENKNHGDYNCSSVRDLVKFIRDKKEHYDELPKDFQLSVHEKNNELNKYCGKEVNKTSHTSILDNIVGYEWYFRKWFPKLLIEVYKVLKEHCGEETGLQDYFKKNVGTINHQKIKF